MISALVSFSLVSRDIKTSLERVAKQGAVKRDLDYFETTISSIKTVDGFMKDSRIYNFAMKSFGLEDMAYAKGFIRKVLESDLNDLNSFANRLSDRRYRDFAAAFSFSSATADTQTQAQEDELIGLYKQSYSNEEKTVATEGAYYSSRIDQARTVDDFLSNERLRTYALRAYGIDPTYTSRSYLRSVLTSDIDDAESFVNQTGSEAFLKLAREFGFNKDGTISSATAQTAAQKNAVMENYNITVPSFVTSDAAQINKAYYEKAIQNVASVSDISSDRRLMGYLTTAYSLSPTLSAVELKLIMTSDLSNPGSHANLVGAASMVMAFNFDENGQVLEGTVAQEADKIKNTTDLYLARYDTVRKSTVEDAAKNFSKRMAAVASLQDFMLSNKDDKDSQNNKLPELYHVALRAYGIGSDEISGSTLKKILTSDPYDPKSFVSSTGDSRLIALAKAFNFATDGKAAAPVTAVTDIQISRWVGDYRARTTILLKGGALEKAKKEVKAEAEYFAETMANLKTTEDFIKDKRLVAFVAKAVGLDPKPLTSDDLKKAFASNLSDQRSFLNSQADPRLRDIVAAFSVDKSGQVTRRDSTAASERSRLKQLFLNQTLEQQQGEANDGVRLALYFQRKAPDITSIYTILGDKALFEVVTTVFSLPSEISAMPVDRQVTMLTKFIKLEDLQNQTKVQSLLKRFASMYDLKNSAGADSYSVLLSRNR
ncbi:DUF1217 domain-containing protein [Rhizobium leguminosarum]|nr:DUF1217 domain-containing protein [Rhizobium ruizarguesonis]